MGAGSISVDVMTPDQERAAIVKAFSIFCATQIVVALKPNWELTPDSIAYCTLVVADIFADAIDDHKGE